ncbi:glycosyltransferase family 2 protein [Micromonospora sp. HM5-17]|jgi:glycosyltransferase involved in cell wall biosynthesis|uniref:glycosyltransferase family 2 protein n=1 Tax=Micromonospora sp. HM5-17 TaxID=2487710 RepID=UPI000F4AE7CD|nr:glycosyltransferase family 2 protein [Micromonospora sp. HM5-17]ROT26349.1 glycosyltransferase family 2 protein [Micromonospora sp. HM5-17]
MLSVIVPVYQVRDYLADCLDSILGQPFSDLELVAVDDASTDGCAEILAGYAARDPRMVVLTFPVNRGLGAARNAGLARATGEYVWFVDADDWLPAGTLPAVADRLTGTRPDLLVTAYTRHYPDGRIRHCPLSGVAGGAPPPEVFALRDVPGLLQVLHITCNKVIRRGFLTNLGLAFGSGWYEDVSFSFPLMLAAPRISLLDRCCYAYRQRPSGAITCTVSDRHFEVFAHWDRVMAGLGSAAEVSSELRQLIFERMIWHLLQVLGHPRRVPPHRRREFFAEIVTRYRRHVPPGGYRPPRGTLGLKHRLVGRGAYRLFAALRAARQVHVGVVARVRPPLPVQPPVARSRTRPVETAASSPSRSAGGPGPDARSRPRP